MGDSPSPFRAFSPPSVGDSAAPDQLWLTKFPQVNLGAVREKRMADKGLARTVEQRRRCCIATILLRCKKSRC